jgi:acyl-CoA thioester hydrolase
MIMEEIMIHFEDLDAMGVVHSGRYVNVFERALAAYWSRAGWSYDPSHPRFTEMLFVVREFAITYHAPIARAGTVLVRLWLERLGTTSLIYGFQVLSADETVVHAEGRRVQVRLDPATLRPAPITPELKSACRSLVKEEQADVHHAA